MILVKDGTRYVAYAITLRTCGAGESRRLPATFKYVPDEPLKACLDTSLECSFL